MGGSYDDCAERRYALETARRTGGNRSGIALLAVVVLVVTGVVTLLGSRWPDGRTAGSASPVAGTAEANARQKPARRTPGDPYALGPSRAPAVLVVYADFGCVYCAEFSRQVKPELTRRYVDKGLLRLEWRDYPLIGEESTMAARAGRAAAAQGRFWEFSTAVYGSPSTGPAYPDLSRGRLVDAAARAGVGDLRRFEADLDGTAYDLAIQDDLNEGVRYGLSSTPTFVLNGRILSGSQPVEVLAAVIDEAVGGPR